MKTNRSRRRLTLLALTPLILGVAIAGVYSEPGSPASQERALPKSNEDAPSKEAVISPLSPTSTENSERAEDPAPAAPTHLRPGEATGPSLYASSSAQPIAVFHTHHVSSV
ncbi:MAG: hypothetical protein ACREV5_14305 [Steroidobacter sp.]